MYTLRTARAYKGVSFPFAGFGRGRLRAAVSVPVKHDMRGGGVLCLSRRRNGSICAKRALAGAEAPEAAKTPANTEDLIASLMAAESEPAVFYADPAFELAVFSSMIDTKLAKDEINATML